MSLSLDLTTLPGSSYLPRPEHFAPGNNPGDERRGIWDILGTYYPSIGIIVLYEDEITKCALSISPKRPEHIYPIIRELVRLHEHAHARFTHFCFGYANTVIKSLFLNLKAY